MIHPSHPLEKSKNILRNATKMIFFQFKSTHLQGDEAISKQDVEKHAHQDWEGAHEIGLGRPIGIDLIRKRTSGN